MRGFLLVVPPLSHSINPLDLISSSLFLIQPFLLSYSLEAEEEDVGSKGPSLLFSRLKVRYTLRSYYSSLFILILHLVCLSLQFNWIYLIYFLAFLVVRLHQIQSKKFSSSLCRADDHKKILHGVALERCGAREK
jgi:hypothetical protein